MKKLIKALNIFLKYGNKQYPISCEHDVLYVIIDPEKVSIEDKRLLEKLTFEVDDDLNCFYSFHYGN